MADFTGTRIKTRGSSADDFVDFAPRVTRGLKGIFLTNTSLAKACHNFWPGGPDAAPTNPPPAVGSQSITCQGEVAFLDTRIPEAPEMTFLFAVRSLDTMADGAHRPMYFGTFTRPRAVGVGDAYGVGAYSDAPNSITGFGARGTDPAGAGFVTTIGQFRLFSLVVGANITDMYDETAPDRTHDASDVTGARQLANGTIRLGSGYGATQFSGSCQIAFFMAYAAALTADELALAVEDAKAILADDAALAV